MLDADHDKAAPGPLKGLANSTLGLLHVHLELFSLELEEERERLLRALVLGLIGAGALLLFLGTLTVAILVMVRPEWRIVTACGLTITYLVLGGISLHRAWRTYANSPRPFAATLDEINKNRKILSR
ncbi:putative membrane protein YqjE [Chitinivorax tropicus]|uniref:Putative membrane protein YqjE n=1 Tax=Chitinivorax tropicus TaxID=714531 RepID=A0A840MIR6_9PROT|nr:phage holin family protein [Chitinivorax tropicus]MBB5018300.1 putative membrane protein YqjE [Chitinivorax tropicus]